jgi:hypothetical protein
MVEEEIEKRWLESRRRMYIYINAVLWQDLGIESPKSDEITSWILDNIVKKEIVHVL